VPFCFAWPYGHSSEAMGISFWHSIHFFRKAFGVCPAYPPCWSVSWTLGGIFLPAENPTKDSVKSKIAANNICSTPPVSGEGLGVAIMKGMANKRMIEKMRRIDAQTVFMPLRFS